MSNNTSALLIGIIFLFGLFAGGGAVYLFSENESPIDNSDDDLNSGEIIEDNSQILNESDDSLEQSDDNDSSNSTESEVIDDEQVFAGKIHE